MKSGKLKRIAERVHKRLAEVLLIQARDEALRNVLITGVELSADLSVARVSYRTVRAEPVEGLAERLEGAAGFLRSELAGCLEIRRVPRLRFAPDRGPEHTAEVNALLDRARAERPETR